MFSKPKGYWTKEQCKKDAQQYINYKDFRINSRTVYTIAYNNNWLEDITSHMKKRNKKQK